MKKWHEQYPPYEGNEPYIYFAFAEADINKVGRIIRIMLDRGCRIWYTLGAAGSAEEVLRRQHRADGAKVTFLYLTDAACADQDTKSFVLVNQKFGHDIVCLDPDGTDRRLLFGLRETVPHIPLYRYKKDIDIDYSIIHSQGFEQNVMGEPVKISIGLTIGEISMMIAGAAVLIILAGLIWTGLHNKELQQDVKPDTIVFDDNVIEAAVRKELIGRELTPEAVSGIETLSLEGLPENWDDLEKLSSLKKIVISQNALLYGGALPDGDYTIVLTGGDVS